MIFENLLESAEIAKKNACAEEVLIQFVGNVFPLKYLLLLQL